MDYESRKVKWYWLLLFLIYCGAVVYALFQGNPLLYSRSELRQSLNSGANAVHHTIPLTPDVVKLTSPTFYSSYNPEHTGLDPMTGPRSKALVDHFHAPLKLEIPNFKLQNVSEDGAGFYLTFNLWAAAVDFNGSLLWKYHFVEKDKERSRELWPILLDEAYSYLIHPQGEVVVLDKHTGRLRWVQDLKEEVVASPFFWKSYLVVPTKEGASVRLTLISRINGQLADENPHLEIKPGFQVSWNPDNNSFIFTVENKVVAIDPDEWQVLWSQFLTDPIRGAAMVQDGQVYVATLGAKLIKLDGNKKGKLDWETDLVKPAAGSPSYVPLLQRVAVLDTSGAISMVDAKSGKVYWRYSTENRNPLAQTWSARIKGQYIEEYHMDWLHKGWTVWSSCYEAAFCIYTPNKGALVARISLGGRPLTLPQTSDRRLIFLTQNKSGELAVDQVLEESEIKKLKSEPKH